jgi:hypothetical protein
MEIINWVQTHWKDISQVVIDIVGAASILIRLFPILDKNHWFLPVVKFVGKYIALNVNVTDADRPALKP